MIYQIYIYGTNIISKDAIGMNIINRAIRTNQEKDWKSWHADELLKEFDVEGIKDQIQKELGERCKVDIKYPPKQFKQVAYLSVVTSYEQAREVLVCAHAIAEREGLVFYDVERGETIYRDLVDDGFILLKRREESIHEDIMAEKLSIYDYRRLYSCESETHKESAFVVTLNKIPDVALEKRVQQFYDTLKNVLIEDEELVCKHGCFTISSELYSISFCLEAYGNHPSRMGYYYDGQPGVHVLNRMGCYEAFEWLEQCTELEKDDTVARMVFLEMKRKYKNPAKRFVKSVDITKKLQQEKFGVRYSGWGYYNSEILFNIAPEKDLNNAVGISTLKIDEDAASFILPFVYDIYPYIYARYYGSKNYLPMEMWKDIIDRILEAKEMVLHDTFNPQLKSYIEQFHLYILSEDSDDESYYESGDGYRIKNEPEKFLYDHRYKVAHLYDIFVEWSRAQILHYSSWTNEMFNIQGP